MTKAIKQASTALAELLESEGGISLVLTLPALVYFFGSMAFQPF